MGFTPANEAGSMRVRWIPGPRDLLDEASTQAKDADFMSKFQSGASCFETSGLEASGKGFNVRMEDRSLH